MSSLPLDASIRAFLDASPLGILLVDEEGTIRAANQSAAGMFACEQDELPGSSVETLMPEPFRSSHVRHRQLFLSAPAARPMGIGLELVGLRRTGEEFPMEIGLGQLELSGVSLTLCFISDLSVGRRIQEENEKLASALQIALEEVSRLSGPVPVCAACKRYRDPQGTWWQLEGGVERHTDQEISHGLCPDCARRLYPQYFPALG
jgi:PAS domain S-box-containing protein